MMRDAHGLRKWYIVTQCTPAITIDPTNCIKIIHAHATTPNLTPEANYSIWHTCKYIEKWVGQFSDLLSCAITWKAHGLIYLEYGLWVFLFESTRNILSPVHSSTAFPELWDFSALNWRLWASIELQQNSQGLCKITKNAKVIPNDQGCSK